MNPDGGPSERAVIRVFGLAHDPVRAELVAAIESQPDMSVVGQAQDARQALPDITRARPDVALVDAHLGIDRGVDACPVIRRACPTVACLLMASMTDERTLVEGAVAGAASIVPKQLRGTATVDAIRAVGSGARLFDFPQTRQALERLGAALSTPPDTPLRRLLELMSEGRDRAEIAGRLGVSLDAADALVDRLLDFVGLDPGDYPG